MGFVRNIARDRLMAGLLAVLIANLLLLQGLAGAYAKTAMAAQSADPAFVLCAPSGVPADAGQHPLDGFAHACCSALCNAACATGCDLVAGGDVSVLPAAAAARTIVYGGRTGPDLRKVGLSRTARGPPARSI